MEDPFDLGRFVRAQAGVLEDALAEIRSGRKRTHWMWFVFPQLRGLGPSPLADVYGISSLEEARAVLRHPRLGPALRACAEAARDAPARTLAELFPHPDDLKFRSSMTLFAAADPDGPFRAALDRWRLKEDEATLARLGLRPGPPPRAA